MSIEDELFNAVKDRNISKVESILNNASMRINAQDERGNTLLHVAVLHRYYEIISLLIKRKIRTDMRNHIGQTPLHLAVSLNDFAMVNTLLELCLKPDIADIDGNLPIHLATEMGCVEVIELLYGDKDTINKKNKCGLTPLHLAVQKGCRKIVGTLIYGGADFDIQDDSEKGDTALIMAAKKNHLSIVELLLNNGADYNKANNAGETFGAFAISEEMINIVSKYDEFTNLSMPSTSGFSSHKRKTLSDISNTSSSSSSSRVRMRKRKRAIDETSDINSPMSYEIDCLIHKNKEFSDMSSTSSSEPKIRAYTFKHRDAIDGSISAFLAYRWSGLDNLSSVSSESKSMGSTDTLDISPPRSDISEPLVSRCRDALFALNLHYSAPSSPGKAEL